MGAKAELQKRCEQEIRTWFIPEPFDLGVFIEHLAIRRGRPIRICSIPADIPALPTGMWLPNEDEGLDDIFIGSLLTPWQFNFNVFHECGHMMLEHRPVDGAPDYSFVRVLEHLDPEWVRKTLMCRAHFSDPNEQQAEMIASVISAGIKKLVVQDSITPVPVEVDDVLRRLGSALGSRS